jgi:sulfatase maturation enzyme AslB (radical SAM superfamily)
MAAPSAMSEQACERLQMIERISIEPSRKCSKGCTFCYNASNPAAGGDWSAANVIAFVRDCATHGVRAASFGGGEPLEWKGIFDVLEALRGELFRSLTTNGLLLDAMLDRLAAAKPDKVHVSIHAPENTREVARVIAHVQALERAGIRSGVNLVVRASRLEAARAATTALHAAGIGNERIVHLPMRGDDTPSPADVAWVAGPKFQSMTCLAACGKSERFASIAADRTVAWCSYTRSRRRLDDLTYAALARALDGLGLVSCASL